jgi:hypothetical protein
MDYHIAQTPKYILDAIKLLLYGVQGIPKISVELRKVYGSGSDF